jgi:hypothetical protein
MEQKSEVQQQLRITYMTAVSIFDKEKVKTKKIAQQ